MVIYLVGLETGGKDRPEPAKPPHLNVGQSERSDAECDIRLYTDVHQVYGWKVAPRGETDVFLTFNRL